MSAKNEDAADIDVILTVSAAGVLVIVFFGLLVFVARLAWNLGGSL